MPTGSGKTLIAARTIDHFIIKYPTKMIAMLTPTGALCKQQAEYLQQYCRKLRSRPFQLHGKMSKFLKKKLGKKLQTCVIVSTPQHLYNAWKNETLDINKCSLLVFDECHYATKNHGYANILQLLHEKQGGNYPRILGLTASFCNSSLKSLEKKKIELEELMSSRILTGKETLFPLNRTFYNIRYSDLSDVNREMLHAAIERACDSLRFVGSSLNEIIKTAKLLCTDLGTASGFSYLENQVWQVEYQIILAVAERTNDGNTYFETCAQKIIEFRARLEKLRHIHIDMVISPKAEKLRELLSKIFDGAEGIKGIVFVERICFVRYVQQLIQKWLNDKGIKSTGVTGSNSMSENDREKNLDLFREGKVQVMVATNVLEEGIDVPTCAFVIRYDKFNTTKNHIQGSGRARSWNANVYYFVNDCELEEEKKEMMISACDTEIGDVCCDYDNKSDVASDSPDKQFSIPKANSKIGDVCCDCEKSDCASESPGNQFSIQKPNRNIPVGGEISVDPSPAIPKNEIYSKEQNPKGILLENLAMIWRKSPKDFCEFKTTYYGDRKTVNMFQSTISIKNHKLCPGGEFSGQFESKKKKADQSACAKALKELRKYFYPL